MQKYVKVAFESRGLDPAFDPPPLCEYCEYLMLRWEMTTNEVRKSKDVEHIFWRKGKLLLDPTNLLFICRQHHSQKWGYDMKMLWKEIVLSKLI